MRAHLGLNSIIERSTEPNYLDFFSVPVLRENVPAVNHDTKLLPDAVDFLDTFRTLRGLAYQPRGASLIAGRVARWTRAYD